MKIGKTFIYTNIWLGYALTAQPLVETAIKLYYSLKIAVFEWFKKRK